MKSLKKIFLLSLLIFGLTNCGTTLFTLTPDEESFLETGRKIIKKRE